MKSNTQLDSWKNNENLLKFLSQVHSDVYVGKKNGVPEIELKDTFDALINVINDSIEWSSDSVVTPIDTFIKDNS